ncbi:MAG: type II toxin-antitoxin system RelE/ParE family toxin [Methylococcaceae bacterium]
MAEINWTAEVERWDAGYLRLYRQDKPAAAANVIFGIYQKAQLLRDFPEIGYLYRKEFDGDIRILLYGHYRIAYLIKSQEKIDILGVFHGALNIERFVL